MIVGFYFDEHMSRAVANGLKQRGISVVMAADVGMKAKHDDTEHLPYATECGLILVTLDRPFAGRTMSRTDHAGLVCISESLRRNIGGMIRVLVRFAEQHELEAVVGRVFWLNEEST